MPSVVKGRKQEDELPPGLKGYDWYGLEMHYEPGSTVQALATCPWCLKENKLYISPDSGMWDCKSCGEKGNLVTFMRLLHQYSFADTPEVEYQALADNRCLLLPGTLREWGVCQSILSGEWLVPGYLVDGHISQLYRYTSIQKRMRLLVAPGTNHHLHGVNQYDKACSTVYLCEGFWDGCALWEVLQQAGRLQGVSVLATPGSNVYLPSWNALFAGKRVVLLYDNDHPTANGQQSGYDGMKRVAQQVVSAEEPAKGVKYLEWGTKGFDPQLPSGYDLRDCITEGSADTTLVDRTTALDKLFTKVKDIPEAWLDKIARSILPCDSWKELTTAWRKAMKWTEGLDRALSVMLASVTSTRATGDQLWIKIIGPASCGKSTLCEALSVNKRHILAKSSIRGFHSGFKAGKGEGDTDNSLLAQVKDKTLVTKDGDTLLQSPNLGQILSEARDVYDRNSRTHYRNKASRDYENINMTWILCGTNSLRSLDKSELGERFLDCVIMDGIERSLEDDILLRQVNTARRALTFESNGTAQSHDQPEMTLVKQLTGGYVDHLRRNAQRLLTALKWSDAVDRQCVTLGKFVAYMRARPSTKQDETAERELAARLVSQMVRLAGCLAVVLGEKEVTVEVMRRVRMVALDTARGRTLDMMRHMYNAGADGVEVRALAMWTHLEDDKLRKLLRFLANIKAVESFLGATKVGLKAKLRWRLTEEVEQLYAEVMPTDLEATSNGKG